MTAPVAILGGTGAEGVGLALRFGRAGCRVFIGSRDLARAQAAASRVPGATGLLNHEAAAQGGFVILAVPAAARVSAWESVREHLRPGTIVIDASARIPPQADPVVLQPPAGASLVAAFQTVSAHLLHDLERPLDSDILICGDDSAAKSAVAALVRLLPGARPVDAGPLKNLPLLDALASLLIAVNRRYRIRDSGVRITGLPDPLPL